MATTRKSKGRERKKEESLANELPTKILAIDIGGTKVKILATGQTDSRKLPSGKRLTPADMVEGVKKLADDWDYDAISIGYPGQVGDHGPRAEPGNLGPGWVGFNFAAAFEKPVRIINDAAMQALGSYEGGRMLFLGLGTGLGSALIAQSVVVALELGRMLNKDGQTLGSVLGRQGLKRIGKEAWRDVVKDTVAVFAGAFVTDYIVIGGGNAKVLKEPPSGARLGHNLTAFRGGFRLWNLADVPTLSVAGEETQVTRLSQEWRVI